MRTRGTTRLNHRNEIVTHQIQRLAAQAVVGAQLQKHNARPMLLEGCGEPVAATYRGLATDAGINHAVIELFGCEFVMQEVYPAAALGQPVAGCEAVAENENHRLLRPERGSRKQTEQKDPADE